MSVEDIRLINKAGISHLFVVSGLHISLVALLLVAILSWLQRPLLLFKWRYTTPLSLSFGILIATGYAYVSGFNTPAIRALFMLFCSMIIIWGQRKTETVNYWLLALTALIVIYPMAFFDMGSWLSFGIVLSLIVGLSGVSAVSVDGKGGDSSERFEGLIINNLGWIKISQVLKGVVSSQWLAFCIGGMILTVYYFPVSAVSLVLNFFLVPFIGLIFVPLAMMGLLLAILGFPDLLVYCEWLITYILQNLHGLSDLINASTLPIHNETRGLAYLAFVILILPRALGFFSLGLLIFALILIWPANTPDKGAFTLMILDVGQGSSAVIQTKEHSMLIDTGYGSTNKMGMADYVVLPYLQQKNIQELDRLLLTHDDADHAGGYETVKTLSSSIVRQDNCKDETWVWDDVVFQQFQSPDHQTGNNGSCLLKVTAKEGASVLFTGDVEKKAEKALLQYYSERLKSEVLVVPHHGSKTSSSQAFLDAVDPLISVISAGKLNYFGHPHSEVVQRYKARLVKIYSTASHGAIEVEFSPRQEARIVSTYRLNNVYEQ